MAGRSPQPRRARVVVLALTLAVGAGGLRLAANSQAAGDGSASAPTSSTSCPAGNPPTTLTLVSGTPQTAQVDSPFAGGLQVALANADGCPVTTAVAGTPVTFTAPAGGASAVFSSSGSDALTVGSDDAGNVAAAMLTANDTAGSYTVTATSAYGTVTFALTNTAAGLAASVVALAPTSDQATVDSGYAQRLRLRVRSASGSPIVGTTVTFTLGSTTGATGAGAGASFLARGAQATATTGASGIATSPPLTANGVAGTFKATATLSGTTDVVQFTLRNRAGSPTTITTGVAARESATVDDRFAIPLAVTVTDAEHNPAPGVEVTFTAPVSGASGSFATGSRRRRAATTRTDAAGVAVAPPLIANGEQGGYIVMATVGHARSAAFALVNEAP